MQIVRTPDTTILPCAIRIVPFISIYYTQYTCWKWFKCILIRENGGRQREKNNDDNIPMAFWLTVSLCLELIDHSTFHTNKAHKKPLVCIKVSRNLRRNLLFGEKFKTNSFFGREMIIADMVSYKFTWSADNRRCWSLQNEDEENLFQTKSTFMQDTFRFGCKLFPNSTILIELIKSIFWLKTKPAKNLRLFDSYWV